VVREEFGQFRRGDVVEVEVCIELGAGERLGLNPLCCHLSLPNGLLTETVLGFENVHNIAIGELAATMSSDLPRLAVEEFPDRLGFYDEAGSRRHGGMLYTKSN
jgi:hypothetical protein